MSSYAVCVGTSSKNLSDEVNKALKEGWQLQGGVTIAPYHFSLRAGRIRDEVETWRYVQAVTHPEDGLTLERIL